MVYLYYHQKMQRIKRKGRVIPFGYKQSDDPAPWNHSQDTPLRDFYKRNLHIIDTKNNQREYIDEMIKSELDVSINKIIGVIK